MNILIVWQEIPGEALFYYLHCPLEHARILKCHNKFVGTDDDSKDVDWLFENYINGKEPVKNINELVLSNVRIVACGQYL